MIVTAQTTDEEIRQAAAGHSYQMGITGMAQFLERLFKLERDAALDKLLKQSGYR